MAKVNQNFIQFIETGIKAYSKQNTLDTLGDRSTYVGSSDIGQCPRKAFLSKVSPKEVSLQQEIIFARGHNAELIIKSAMIGNQSAYEEQVEVQGRDELSFIKTHIDFLMKTDKQMVVVECKSVNSIPNEPYLSWILQVQLQIGLLRNSIPPVPCERGVIAVVNVNSGELTAFDIPFSQDMYDMAIKKAKVLWESLQNNTEPPAECGSLCGFCPYKESCPILHAKAEELPLELEQDALHYANLQSQIKDLSKKSDGIKAKLIDFMSATSTKKVKVKEYSLSYTQMNGRVGVDTKALQDRYPEIYEELKTVGKPYAMLKIS